MKLSIARVSYLFTNGRSFLYWEKGNQNEIELVAVNNMKKEIVVAEIKMNPSKININILKRKSKRLIASYPEYRPKWIGLSLKEAVKYL